MSNLGDKLVLGTVVAGLLFFMTAEAKADDLYLQERIDCGVRALAVKVELGQGMRDLIAWECATNTPNLITGKVLPSFEVINTLVMMQFASIMLETARENN
tara:strand:+ start:181 stop:483 length:303 start_codon:yes stop_codon:yes gene_type:complete